jgi:hypothetical protein
VEAIAGPIHHRPKIPRILYLSPVCSNRTLAIRKEHEERHKEKFFVSSFVPFVTFVVKQKAAPPY